MSEAFFKTREVIIQGARECSDLVHLSIVLEPAGDYCGHWTGTVGTLVMTTPNSTSVICSSIYCKQYLVQNNGKVQ